MATAPTSVKPKPTATPAGPSVLPTATRAPRPEQGIVVIAAGCVGQQGVGFLLGDALLGSAACDPVSDRDVRIASDAGDGPIVLTDRWGEARFRLPAGSYTVVDVETGARFRVTVPVGELVVITMRLPEVEALPNTGTAAWSTTTILARASAMLALIAACAAVALHPRVRRKRRPTTADVPKPAT